MLCSGNECAAFHIISCVPLHNRPCFHLGLLRDLCSKADVLGFTRVFPVVSQAQVADATGPQQRPDGETLYSLEHCEHVLCGNVTCRLIRGLLRFYGGPQLYLQWPASGWRPDTRSPLQLPRVARSWKWKQQFCPVCAAPLQTTHAARIALQVKRPVTGALTLTPGCRAGFGTYDSYTQQYSGGCVAYSPDFRTTIPGYTQFDAGNPATRTCSTATYNP